MFVREHYTAFAARAQSRASFAFYAQADEGQTFILTALVAAPAVVPI